MLLISCVRRGSLCSRWTLSARPSHRNKWCLLKPMHKACAVLNPGSSTVRSAHIVSSFELILEVFTLKVSEDEAWAYNTFWEPQANMTLLALGMNMFTMDLICSLLLSLKPMASDVQMKFIIRKHYSSLAWWILSWLFFDVVLFEYFRLLKEQKVEPAVPSVPVLMNHCSVSLVTETPSFPFLWTNN